MVNPTSRISSTKCDDCANPKIDCVDHTYFVVKDPQKLIKALEELQISNTKRNFPEIVVLCGSTRFYDLFNEMNVKFTLQGKIVLSIGDHQRADHGTYYEEYKEMLGVLHKRKIDLADKVFVINKNGYIGESTRSEIDYAIKVNKPIEYMEV